MSDFEKRLGEALSVGAEEAPGSTVGLAAGARRRSRARRRTAGAGVAAAVALAVAAPVLIVGLGGSDSSAPVADRVTDPNVGEVAETKATRTETWRNVTLEVPPDWEYGGVTAWCAVGRTLDTPVVQRPGIAVPAVGCSPSSGYGVTLGSLSLTDRGGFSGEVSQPDDEYVPEGAWFGFVTGPAGDVTVTAPDEATARSVLGSLTVLDDDERDPNGCTPRNPDDGGVLASEQMSICRYTADGWLEQSERLSAADTAKAVTALNTAPDGTKPLRTYCQPEPDDPGTVITMNSSDYAAEVVLDKPCTLNTSFRSEVDGYRKLTRDVMFWALSPGWSGSLAPGVPKPEPLRQLVAPEQDPIADDLQTIEYDGIVVEIPQDWTLFDGEDCEFPVVRAGPPGTDPCDPQTAPLSFYGEANFDASTAPGELVSGDDSSLVFGYVIAGEYAVAVQVPDRALARRILDSVREVGAE